MKPFVKQVGTRRTQNAGFLLSFSVVLFMLPLLFAHTAYGDINSDLLEAVKAGDTAKVEQLLRKGADVNAETEDGRTALITVAYRGHTETVKALIDAGADVNAKRTDGRTALMIAAGMGRTEIVDILKQVGAQAETTVDAKTIDSRTHSVAAQRQSDPVITTNPALERLTVPAELLPDGCELAPGTGLPFGSPDNPNPMMTTNPTEIGVLVGFVFMGINAISSELNAKMHAVTEAERDRIFKDWMREQAAKIEVAYLAGYSDKHHKENMVWALQFKNPKEAKNYFEPVRIANQSAEYNYYFIKDSIIIYVWTDNRGDASCFDAIRGYLEKD